MIHIRKGAFRECVDLSTKIPEFNSPYKIEEYKKRCAGKYLALIAEIDNKPGGFKLAMTDLKMAAFIVGWVAFYQNFAEWGLLIL